MKLYNEIKKEMLKMDCSLQQLCWSIFGRCSVSLQQPRWWAIFGSDSWSRGIANRPDDCEKNERWSASTIDGDDSGIRA